MNKDKPKPEREDGQQVSGEDLKKSEPQCPTCRRSVWDCTCPKDRK